MMLLSEDLFKEAKIAPGLVVCSSMNSVGTDRGELAAKVLTKARVNNLAIMIDFII